ncbi:MAG: serine/threonine protein kinase [Polyangiales bacterium]
MPTAPSDPHDLTGSVVLGRYRLVSAIAQGGMGVIYLARQEGDAGFMRPAVIKRLRPDMGGDMAMVELFMREARILSHLQHPAIVGVLDFAVEAGCHVMALEYVAGYHVGLWARYLRKRKKAFDASLVMHIVSKVLDALDYVHSRTDDNGEPMGIVHRDVTPSNVLVDREGNVKLLDFGIARSEDEATKDASERSIKGKFSYISPEALDGAPPTAQGDIYSCGVMIHALIWGRNYFLASTPAETLRRVLDGGLPALSERFQVPAGLDAVIAKATAADPAERYATAREMLDALRGLQEREGHDLSDRLRRAAQLLYSEDALPAGLGLATLEERDALWKNFVAAPVAEPGPLSNPAPAPVPDMASRPPPAHQRAWIVTVTLLVLALLAVGGGAAYFFGQRERATPTIIVEQRSLADDSNQAAQDSPGVTAVNMAPAEPTPADMSESPASMEPQAEVSMMGMGGTSPEQRLARSFARSVPALRRCFVDHGETTASSISVRLRVGTSGRVERATVTPRTLGTGLMGCLTQVSEGIRFEPQSDVVTFQVPVTIRQR